MIIDMSTILLKTKLHIPPARLEWVRRAHLFQKLDAGLHCKLTLVSAPAGFGKSTLLSAWLNEKQVPAAWLALELDDNQFARFWLYLVAALHSMDTRIGEELVSVLRSSPLPSTEAILTELLEDIEKIQYSFVLVLDDFQVIDNPDIKESLLFLLEHLPQTLHLVLSTRADPPWPLARFRARGEMVELRAVDLRFSALETSEFLNTRMGLALTLEDVALLDEHTEGWIAGLQLAAISMQSQADKSAFIQAFTGSHRFILDYLVEEVLSHLPAGQKEFLLKTCILDRLNAPLGDALVKIDNSREVLSQLEKANLFLISLDDERRWYRYHLLFADVLRGVLAQEFPQLVPQLHRRASQWYASYGMLSEAVNHAFKAGDVDYAAQLIEENALIAIMIFNENLPSLAAWMDRLPEQLQSSRPWLALARAWVLAYAGELNAAEAVFLEIERTIATLPDASGSRVLDLEHLAGYLDAIQGYWYFMKGDNLRAAERMRKAGSCLPAPDLPTRVFVAIVLAAAIGVEGDLEGGINVLTEALQVIADPQLSFLAILVLCELAGLQILSGRLKQVMATCQEALELALEYERLMGIPPPNIGFAYARLSYVLREQNKLEVSIHHAQEGVKISRNWGQKDSLCVSYAYLAASFQAAGRTEDALRMINHASRVSRTISAAFDARTAAFEAVLHAAGGDIPFLLHWRDASGLSIEGELPFSRIREYTVYARAMLVEGNFPGCLALLERLLQSVSFAGALLYVIELSVLQALAFDAQGEREQAVLALGRALRLAEPEGFVRLFVDEGAAMRALLQRAVQKDRSSSYASHLLAVMDAVARSEEMPGAGLAGLYAVGSVKGLTQRELEILLKLAIPHSIPELATQLCIETSTLRTHLRNIYDKLGVHNRMEAVAIARQVASPGND